jgi:hypothetical protein
MKTNSTSNPRPQSCRRRLFRLVAAVAAALWSMFEIGYGQIFETNIASNTVGKYTTAGATVNASLVSGLNYPFTIAVSDTHVFVTNYNSGTIGKYTLAGATVNAALITGLNSPFGIAVSGTNLFVVNFGNGTIGKYTTSGATVNAALITGLYGAYGIAVSGGNLFVVDAGAPTGGTIREYTIAGATVNETLITGLDFPFGIAVSGTDLFVTDIGDASPNSGSIGKYTTSGATVNAALVTGLNGPYDLAISGGNLFVTNYSTGTIGKYTTAGATVNASLVTGLSYPAGIDVLPHPLQLEAAVSRKTHGATAFDINLPLTGEPGLECRNGAGNYVLVFTFSNNVVSGTASVTGGTGSVAAAPVFSGNTMTVNLTGVMDVQKIRVTLTNVTDNAGQILNTGIFVNMLVGDTTGNKIVNSSDISQTKAQSGLAVSAANFREDVTVSNSINASDISLVKSRSGFGVP